MATHLDWYGCATFSLRTAGLTIFLDAYIDRPQGAEGTGLTASDVTEADYLLIGHSHFDHLWGAERILENTDATLIGSYESVRVMEQAGVALDRMICVAGGETVALSDDVTVSVYPSQHSCVWSHAKMDEPDVVCLGDLGVTWQDQQQRMRELMSYLSTETSQAVQNHLAEASPGHSDRGDGGALVYLIEGPDGSILFQDSAGAWSGIFDTLNPDVAILAAAGRANIDGEPIQGSLAEFVAMEAAALKPKKLIYGHHDDWMPGFSIPVNTDAINTAVRQMHPSVEIIEPHYMESTEILP
ncbi:MAG: MBL fold metallo-hydrolase [Actinomycetota bacterium]|nr:MBL fold metallo-hydrolase [Actinomycetota bacterium]